MQSELSSEKSEQLSAVMVESFCFSNLIYWQHKLLIVHSGTETRKKREHRHWEHFSFHLLKLPYFHHRLYSSQLCLWGTGGLWLWAWWFLSVTPRVLGVFSLLIPSSSWFSSAALCFGVPQLQHGHLWWLQCHCWCPCSCIVSPGASPTVAHLHPPLCLAQIWGSPWCSPWAQPEVMHSADPGCVPALHGTGAASSCSAASLSLHHSPLRHASMPRLVKACQNNPLNPQRKDLIKLFYSGIHAACWTVCWMTSSMPYECQSFTGAY